MRRALLALAVLAAAPAAAASRAPDPATCAGDFARYDRAVRHYGTISFNESVILPAPLSRHVGALFRDGCLTSSYDLDGLDALAARLAPYRIVDTGPVIPATPDHLGVVTSIFDEARVTQFFRGLGYRSRGIGAAGLGRRLYIGPFTTQGGLDQALQVAREAGFIAPFAARYTKF